MDTGKILEITMSVALVASSFVLVALAVFLIKEVLKDK